MNRILFASKTNSPKAKQSRFTLECSMDVDSHGVEPNEILKKLAERLSYDLVMLDDCSLSNVNLSVYPQM